ncbi:MAG TPA: diacylglycerol kinase family protein [Patescibacteria group bacterium]|nr:diacylglycerol kinase family protein [Patescibacteria group bacterium]
MLPLTMLQAKHSLAKSFKFAFEGLKVAILEGRNFRIQLFFAILAVILGVIYKISSADWLGIFLIVNLVLILELINTSLESIVDLVSPEIHDKAKIAKDVAAAAVLIASVTSILIGIFIFLPKILH